MIEFLSIIATIATMITILCIGGIVFDDSMTYRERVKIGLPIMAVCVVVIAALPMALTTIPVELEVKYQPRFTEQKIVSDSSSKIITYKKTCDVTITRDMAFTFAGDESYKRTVDLPCEQAKIEPTVQQWISDNVNVLFNVYNVNEIKISPTYPGFEKVDRQ